MAGVGGELHARYEQDVVDGGLYGADALHLCRRVVVGDHDEVEPARACKGCDFIEPWSRVAAVS